MNTLANYVARLTSQPGLQTWACIGRLGVFGVALLFGPVVVSAQSSPPASQLPAGLRDVAFDQRLNEQLPLDVVLRDERGRPVTLGSYLDQKPVVLALVYYECPMLCSMQLNGLLRSVRAISLDIGEEYEIVTVSFDPGETPELAARMKQKYTQQYGRPGAANGWHFLTAAPESIQQLTHAVGFRYRYDPETDLFNHASGIMVLTPEGRLSRYFYGIEYPPRDLRLGLVEASENKIGSPVDQLLLFCFHYDPATGKYGFVVMNALRAAGLATVLALGIYMFAMFRRERRQRLLSALEPGGGLHNDRG